MLKTIPLTLWLLTSLVCLPAQAQVDAGKGWIEGVLVNANKEAVASHCNALSIQAPSAFTRHRLRGLEGLNRPLELCCASSASNEHRYCGAGRPVP